MDDKLLRGCRIRGGVFDDYWQMRFSEEEFDKIILPFCIKKEETKDNNGKLIYVSSAKDVSSSNIKKIKGDMEYEI